MIYSRNIVFVLKKTHKKQTNDLCVCVCCLYKKIVKKKKKFNAASNFLESYLTNHKQLEAAIKKNGRQNVCACVSVCGCVCVWPL